MNLYSVLVDHNYDESIISRHKNLLIENQTISMALINDIFIQFSFLIFHVYSSIKSFTFSEKNVRELIMSD
jgi:hypothetical protein